MKTVFKGTLGFAALVAFTSLATPAIATTELQINCREFPGFQSTQCALALGDWNQANAAKFCQAKYGWRTTWDRLRVGGKTTCRYKNWLGL